MDRLIQHRRLTAALGISAAVALTGMGSAAAARSPAQPSATRAGAQPAAHAQARLDAWMTAGAGGLAASPTGCSATYVHADPRLGPASLPATGPLAGILYGYRRFGGQSWRAFLHRFWDPRAARGHGAWRYPPQDGYVRDAYRQPAVFRVWAKRGLRLDRFGPESGSFLSPYGQPFMLRALPPASLDGTGCGYHAYRVARRFLLDAGPVAPWFGQPGYGFRYQLNGALVAGAPAHLTVRWLVRHGYLRRIGG